ncbi:MAG: hypothetical protein JO066_15185 [Verrucomicrobia bacterium]|nr:hypothetical protein [Verrucomicrobiota bacterium]
MKNISSEFANILALGASFTLLFCVGNGRENTSATYGPISDPSHRWATLAGDRHLTPN